jgi:hypothetical protein
VNRLASLLLLFCCAAVLTGCTVCEERIVDETTSPDRAWTTRTTGRDCGEHAVPTMNVYLQRADSRARLGEIIVLVRDAHALHVTWKSSSELQIDCAQCGSDVRIARPAAHGITISVSR